MRYMLRTPVRRMLAFFFIATAVLSESCRPVVTVYNAKTSCHPLPDTVACVLLGMDDTARIAGKYIGYIAYEPIYDLTPPFREHQIDILKTAARSKGANLVEVTTFGPPRRKVGYTVYASMYKVADAHRYEPSVQWTGKRQLDFSDFKGPARLGGDTVRSVGSYEFYLIRDISYPQDKIKYDSRVEFYGNASWIDKEAADSSELLIHEQGNFDLCENYRLQLERALRDPLNENILPEDIYWQIHDAYLATRARYESDTAHGLDYTAQAEWTRKIITVSSFNVGRLLTRRQLEKKAKLVSPDNSGSSGSSGGTAGHQKQSALPVLPDPFWGPGPSFPVPFRS